MAGVNLADRLPHGAVGLEEVDVQVQDDVLVVRAVGAVGFVGTLADVESMQEESLVWSYLIRSGLIPNPRSLSEKFPVHWVFGSILTLMS